MKKIILQFFNKINNPSNLKYINELLFLSICCNMQSWDNMIIIPKCFILYIFTFVWRFTVKKYINELFIFSFITQGILALYYTDLSPILLTLLYIFIPLYVNNTGSIKFHGHTIKEILKSIFTLKSLFKFLINLITIYLSNILILFNINLIFLNKHTSFIDALLVATAIFILSQSFYLLCYIKKNVT